MTDPDPQGLSTPDRRREQRMTSSDAVKIHIQTADLDGVASNLSSSGILFFTDDELKVSVEVVSDGEAKTLTGHLVRCERIKGNHRGWAVEFDKS